MPRCSQYPAAHAAFNTSRVVDPHFKLALLEPVEDEEDEDEINNEEEVNNDDVDEVEIREQLGLDECSIYLAINIIRKDVLKS